MTDDTRLIPVSGPDIVRLQDLSYTKSHMRIADRDLLRSLADSYEDGITEREQRALCDAWYGCPPAGHDHRDAESAVGKIDAAFEPHSGEK